MAGMLTVFVMTLTVHQSVTETATPYMFAETQGLDTIAHDTRLEAEYLWTLSNVGLLVTCIRQCQVRVSTTYVITQQWSNINMNRQTSRDITINYIRYQMLSRLCTVIAAEIKNVHTCTYRPNNIFQLFTCGGKLYNWD